MQSRDAAPQPRGIAEAAATPSGPATEAAVTAAATAAVEPVPSVKELPPDNNAIVYEPLVVRVCGTGAL